MIDGQFLAGGQFGGPFGLEAFARRAPLGDQVVAVHHFADQRLVGGDDLAHFRLDFRQVVVGERAILRREIIIETIVGGRAEGDLGAREQRLHRFGQHMRIVMARQVQRVRFVARGDQRQRGVGGEGA